MLHILILKIFLWKYRQQVEDAFVELDERYRNLEEKSKQLCELAEKNKDITITGIKNKNYNIIEKKVNDINT